MSSFLRFITRMEQLLVSQSHAAQENMEAHLHAFMFVGIRTKIYLERMRCSSLRQKRTTTWFMQSSCFGKEVSGLPPPLSKYIDRKYRVSSFVRFIARMEPLVVSSSYHVESLHSCYNQNITSKFRVKAARTKAKATRLCCSQQIWKHTSIPVCFVGIRTKI